MRYITRCFLRYGFHVYSGRQNAINFCFTVQNSVQVLQTICHIFKHHWGFFIYSLRQKLEEKFPPFSRKRLINRSFSCLSPLALKLEMRPFEPCSYTLSWQRGLLYYCPHIFSRNVAHSSASPYMKTLNLT